MAKKQVVTYSYSCDICGTELLESIENAEQRISWDGRDYEVDLCPKDQQALQKVLEGLQVYVLAGRRSSGNRARPRSISWAAKRKVGQQ